MCIDFCDPIRSPSFLVRVRRLEDRDFGDRGGDGQRAYSLVSVVLQGFRRCNTHRETRGSSLDSSDDRT